MAIKSFKKGAAKQPAKPEVKSAPKGAKSAPKGRTAKSAPVDEPGEDENTETRVVRQDQAGAGYGDVAGEVDQSDIKKPKLKIVHSVGDLSERFPQNQGYYCLGGEVLLTDPKTPLDICVVQANVIYQENLVYGSEDMPRVFNTLAEVKDAGGWIEWIDNEKPPFSKALNAVVLIERPEGIADVDAGFFCLEIEGKEYALAQWRLTGTAYTSAGKDILTAKAMSGGRPLCSRLFKLTTERVKKGVNWVWVPRVKNAGKTSDEFQTFVAEHARC